MSRDYVVNSFDVIQRIKPSVAIRASRVGFDLVDAPSRGFRENGKWRSFAEIQAAYPHVTEWATPKGRYMTGYWFPANEIPTGDAVPRTESGKKITFVTGVPCEVVTNPHQYHYVTCANPAKEGALAPGGSVLPSATDLVPACGVHAAAWKRRQENDRKLHEKLAAQRESWDRERQLNQASKEWAERLTEEWGLDFHPTRSSEHLLVSTNPEKLHAFLTALSNVARDAMGMSLEDVLEMVREDS